eukprot:TRINITY_DN4310_c0_g1_i5.p1 TRINITY_DN4310_c0_g1~~TRINITY_DN4310_c0_g1_i5.p1  ORF type:complete len:575 (+),score=94.18 TRINITY_DN4310_c0_g1_i5:105-1829(+)
MAGFLGLKNVALVLAFGQFVPVVLVEASSFLGKQNGFDHSMLLPRGDLGSLLSQEIENVLGSDQAAKIGQRLAPMETMLQATLSALPFNEDGRYGHTAVRYALHRLFVKKHGWYMLDMDTNSENASGSTLPDSLPDYFQGLFESRLGSHGLTAHEIALMAAALENLVHRESIKHLDQAFLVAGIKANTNITSEVVASMVIDCYMALNILGHDAEYVRKKARKGSPLKWVLASIEYRYDGWPEVRSFAREIFKEYVGVRTSFTYDDMLAVVELIADRYGRFQNRECVALKQKLLSIEEEEGNGRVTLAQFYKLSLDEDAPFNETRAFLRQLGALDETQIDTPRIMVSNYVLSRTNCFDGSAYYSQCCINECENILEYLERELAAPDAEPARIAALIPSMSSKYATARTIPQSKLLQRLQSIAEGSTGRVRLHSRGFAQWLHHAFPRDCPYPHVWKGWRPMDMATYKEKTGLSYSASLGEMRMIVKNSITEAAFGSSTESVEEFKLWSHEEEFYVQGAPRAERSRKNASKARTFAGLAFFFAVFVLVALKLRALESKESKGCNGSGIFVAGKSKWV